MPRPIVTSQLAFPGDTCDVVYETVGYEQSVDESLPDLARVRQRVRQTATISSSRLVTGSVEEGFVATLTVGT